MSEPVTPVVTRLTLCQLQEDHKDAGLFEIDLERRPGGWWVITRGGWYLDVEGVWRRGADYTDQWRATHWHTLDVALDLAQAVLPRITVNGRTAADVLAAET